MKKILILISPIIFLLFITIPSFSQETGTIRGKVTDNSGQGLEAASVSLIGASDGKVVTGANTDEEGNFELTAVPFGNYKLEVNFIGYATSVVPGIVISSSKKIVELGTIKLSESTTTTETIEVETEKSEIEFKPDRKVFNFENNQIVKGGNAIDVLREVPSITVDVDGNVSLRGSEGVRIQIDGRSFGLEGENRTAILEQLSADQIERVELITNPSAKFNPEGSTGIINIVLKKKSDAGYNGTLSLNAGTTDKYTGGVSFNYRNEGYNLFGNYTYNSLNMNSGGFSRRDYLNTTDELSLLTRNTDGFRRRGGHLFKGGFDYKFNNETSLGLSSTLRLGDRHSSQTVTSLGYDDSGALITNSISKRTDNDDGYNYGFNLNFQKIFGKSDHKFTSELSYEKDHDEDISNNTEFYLITGADPLITRDNELENNWEAELRADYTLPLGEGSKFEAGYRGNIESRDDDSKRYIWDEVSGNYIFDTEMSNKFLYDENVHAVYSTLTSGIAGFNYNAGIRVENANISGSTENTNDNFDNNYLDFFPTASISKKLGMTQELQVSYSRRISRPRLRFLNPFTRYIDQYNIFRGNPDLQPEYTNSFQLDYINYLPIGTITPSVFYRHTTNEITRTSYLIDSVTTLSTFENLNSSKSYGVDLIVSSRPFSFLSMNGNISYYRTDIDDRNISTGTSRSIYSWNGRLNSSIILPEDFGVQLSYFYSGKRVNSRGTIDPFQSLDVAVKKDFLDKNLTLGFRVQDVFNTRKFNIHTDNPSYTEFSERNWDTRSFLFTLSYTFGANSKKKPDTRNRDNQRDEDFDDIDF